MIFESNNFDETYAFAKKLGENALPGQIYTLIGDLGVGKTVFAQGFADGIGIDDSVNSPTFTILQIYDEGRLPLYHFDVYRIEDPEEMFEVGLDEYLYGDGVCLVEWADLIGELIPNGHTRIMIEKDLEKGFDYRRIIVNENFGN